MRESFLSLCAPDTTDFLIQSLSYNIKMAMNDLSSKWVLYCYIPDVCPGYGRKFM